MALPVDLGVWRIEERARSAVLSAAVGRAVESEVVDGTGGLRVDVRREDLPVVPEVLRERQHRAFVFALESGGIRDQQGIRGKTVPVVHRDRLPVRAVEAL